MTNSLCIRNATVVLPDQLQETDVLVEDGIISAIGRGLPNGKETLDASGLILFPGLIDPQVHFREPGNAHKEDLHTGSKAAAAGGITSFLDMPNNNPAVINAERMAAKKQRAAEQCVVNYGFFVGATPENLAEINSVPNVCGIKVFMGSSTGDLLVHREEDLERIFCQW